MPYDPIILNIYSSAHSNSIFQKEGAEGGGNTTFKSFEGILMGKPSGDLTNMFMIVCM